MKLQEFRIAKRMSTEPNIQEEELLLEEKVSDFKHDLIVFNDDVNTFDHVIKCLINICKHSKTQAEQCTYIIHYKGKCAVKKGSKAILMPMLLALQEQNLSAKIK